MDKREVLEYYLGIPNKSGIGTSKFNNSFSIDRALTALNKLEKEKMLEYVGGDKELTTEKYTNIFFKGYNQAKAEIRKKINQPQNKERA